MVKKFLPKIGDSKANLPIQATNPVSKFTTTRNPLPETGYLRLAQIVGDKKAGIPALFPVSKSTWWAGVKAGRYPQPVKLSERCTAWPVAAIRELIERQAVPAGV